MHICEEENKNSSDECKLTQSTVFLVCRVRMKVQETPENKCISPYTFPCTLKLCQSRSQKFNTVMENIKRNRIR